MVAAAESTIRAAQWVLGIMGVGAAAVLVWLVAVMLRSIVDPRP